MRGGRFTATIAAGGLALAGCARPPLPPPPTAEFTVERGAGTVSAVEDPRMLDRVRVGDEVEATYREAIAVAVERPAAR